MQLKKCLWKCSRHNQSARLVSKTNQPKQPSQLLPKQREPIQGRIGNNRRLYQITLIGPFQPKSFTSLCLEIKYSVHIRKAGRSSVHSLKIINRNGSLMYCSHHVGPQTSWTVRNHQNKLVSHFAPVEAALAILLAMETLIETATDHLV